MTRSGSSCHNTAHCQKAPDASISHFIHPLYEDPWEYRTYGKARADALLPSSAKGRHAPSSKALGDLSFRVSSSLTPLSSYPNGPLF